MNNLKTGLIRHLVVRTGHHTNEMMVIFVTNGKKFKHSEMLVEKLKNAFPNITSIKQNINDSHSNVIMGRHSVTLYGKEKIVDQLSEVTFNIQTNHSIKLILPKLKSSIKSNRLRAVNWRRNCIRYVLWHWYNWFYTWHHKRNMYMASKSYLLQLKTQKRMRLKPIK